MTELVSAPSATTADTAHIAPGMVSANAPLSSREAEIPKDEVHEEPGTAFCSNPALTERIEIGVMRLHSFTRWIGAFRSTLPLSLRRPF